MVCGWGVRGWAVKNLRCQARGRPRLRCPAEAESARSVDGGGNDEGKCNLMFSLPATHKALRTGLAWRSG